MKQLDPKRIDPGYAEPEAEGLLVQVELIEATRHIALKSWRLIPVEVADVVPRENIHWIKESDFRDWEGDLIAAFSKDPGNISPILVVKKADEPGKYVILDGHHRWRAAKLSGRKAIWVIEGRGRMIYPIEIERQRRED